MDYPSALRSSRNLLSGGNRIGVGVHDGLSALLASQNPFDFLWLSSFGVCSANGLPDAGIMGAEEVLSVLRGVRRSTNIPIIVDMENGYGDTLKIHHVVKEMLRAGADALCIEDNPLAKRCSLYPGYKRTLVPIEEHMARLRAAKLAIGEQGPSCLLIGRTEALVAGLGVAEALTRAQAYVEAGADAVFVQCTDRDAAGLIEFCHEWKRRTPIFIAPTRYPHITKQEFFDIGASHIIFANQGIRAAHLAMKDTYRRLLEQPSALTCEGQMSSVADLMRDVGEERVQKFSALLETEHPEVKPQLHAMS